MFTQDEDAVDDDGLNLFPHLSTVTYLSGSTEAAPTVVMNCMAGNQYDDPVDGTFTKTFISRPEVGKHLSFDGRYLHGAPTDFWRSLSGDRPATPHKRPATLSSAKQSATSQRPAKRARKQPKKGAEDVRVTFLVNVWLDYEPATVSLTDEVLSELSNESVVLKIGMPTPPQAIVLRGAGSSCFRTRFGGGEGSDMALSIPLPSSLPTDSSILLQHRRGALGQVDE